MATELCIVTRDARVSGATLTGRAERAASLFAAAGVGAGDCVALLMRNDIAFLEASLGCRRLGAYCVPINWHSSADEIRYVISDCAAKMLIAHADLLRALGQDVPCPVVAVPTPPAIAAAYRVLDADAAAPDDVADWTERLDAQEPYRGPPTPPTETLIYTSGTSGHPKGVKRGAATAEQAAANELMRARVFCMGKGARVLMPAPMYHNAPNLFAHRAVAHGDLLVLPPRFEATELLADIEKHRITHLYAVPAMFKRLLALPEAVRMAHDLSSLQVVLHAGGPCAPDLKRAMIEWLGPVIEEYYGSTEAGPVTRVSSREWLEHPGTVGRPVDGITLQIVDDAGNLLAPGEIGEVTTSNPNFPDFIYLNRPADRASLDRHGLLATGDLGYVRDGWLYLCDRKRDMVVSGGVNIYPAEIEAALLGLDGVADCAVFGVPDEEYGEAVFAIVQPAPGARLTEESLQRGLRGRIAGYKTPRRIEFRAELPREDSGKIKKRLLRAPYWAGAGRNI